MKDLLCGVFLYNRYLSTTNYLHSDSGCVVGTKGRIFPYNVLGHLIF